VSKARVTVLLGTSYIMGMSIFLKSPATAAQSKIHEPGKAIMWQKGVSIYNILVSVSLFDLLVSTPIL